MLTKLSVLLFVLFLALPCFAQQPRIDSIAVDEDKGELVLHGDFQNSSSAIVLVDSVSLPVTLTSDTLIRATIPVSGKGSAGWVSITDKVTESNRKLITYVHFYIYHYTSYSPQCFSLHADSINIRADFLDLDSATNNYFICSNLSRCHDELYCTLGMGNNNYDSAATLQASLQYDASKKYFIYPITSFEAATGYTTFYKAYVSIDNNFAPIYHSEISQSNEQFFWGSLVPTDFPPSTTRVNAILSIPNILQAHLSSDPIAENADMIVTLQNPKNTQMQIIDILGHIISSDAKMLQAGENKMPINSSVLLSGIYICRLEADGEVVSVRFVKE